jgi:hypothetical protein
VLRPYKTSARFSGRALRGGLAFRFGFNGAGGKAAFFFGDGFGIDQPLAIARAAGLFFLRAGEAAKAEEAADFGAGGIHCDSGLLGGEPVGEILRHGYITLAASLSGFNSTDKDSYTIC